MSNTFILLSMIFLHILDDFHLQGILCNMKQKIWWESHVQYKPLYKYDYIMSLIVHCFSWAFMIMLLIAYVRNFNIGLIFILVFVLNICIHGIIDHVKANKLKINLIVDQLLHLAQIFVTFICFIFNVL